MKDLKFDVNDITLIPSEKSDIDSRSECQINAQLSSLPLMTAPMDTVVSNKNYKNFIDNGIVPCIPRGLSHNYFPEKMHYFQAFGLSEIEKSLYDFKKQNNSVNGNVFIHTAQTKGGIKEVVEFNKPQFYHFPNVLIDIANGHMTKLVSLVEEIKMYWPDIILMVGNIANPETFINLGMAGADYIRCSIGSGAGCFVKNTQVLTDNGYKNIQDINIGDKVLTYKHNYKEVINKISYVDEDNLIKINNNICTKNHKYYVLNKTYKDIICDDNIEKYAEWVEAENITNEYWLLENTL